MTEAKDDNSLAIDCVRCGQSAAPATGIFYGGALGDEIRAKTCRDCWAEWRENEVIVINELRLNFMDPKSQDVLTEQLRLFLKLDPEPDTG